MKETRRSFYGLSARTAIPDPIRQSKQNVVNFSENNESQFFQKYSNKVVYAKLLF